MAPAPKPRKRVASTLAITSSNDKYAASASPFFAILVPISRHFSYEILLIDTLNNTSIKIDHDIPIDGREQGGLLDIVSENNIVWVTCSIQKGRKYTTAVYRAELQNNKLINEKLIYEALPYIDNGKHFGSRIEILDDYLYVSVGERGKGMIAQDFTNSIGSIIRIHKNGEYPKDNPFIKGNNWLPELFQIGVRNPQGMTLDPQTKTIYISNHGPKGGDEINIIVAGGNYGWPLVSHGFEYGTDDKVSEHDSLPGFNDPEWVWIPSIAPSGMDFYPMNSGEKVMFPNLQGSLLVGSLKFRRLYSISINKDGLPESESILIDGTLGRIRDVAIAKDGSILILNDESSLSKPEGGLYRIFR